MDIPKYHIGNESFSVSSAMKTQSVRHVLPCL